MQVQLRAWWHMLRNSTAPEQRCWIGWKGWDSRDGKGMHTLKGCCKGFFWFPEFCVWKTTKLAKPKLKNIEKWHMSYRSPSFDWDEVRARALNLLLCAASRHWMSKKMPVKPIKPLNVCADLMTPCCLSGHSSEADVLKSSMSPQASQDTVRMFHSWDSGMPDLLSWSFMDGRYTVSSTKMEMSCGVNNQVEVLVRDLDHERGVPPIFRTKAWHGFEKNWKYDIPWHSQIH